MGFEIFSSKRAPLIGVDLGATAIKMVELCETKKGLRVERFAVVPLADGIVVDGVISKPTEYTEAIRTCHMRLGSRSKQVVIALPSESIFFKRLTIAPSLKEEEIEEDVTTQLSSLMLIDPADISVDFQMLGSDSQDASKPGGSDSADGGPQEVLAMAAKREKVDERLLLVESAGLRVAIVDAETLAMHGVIEQIDTARGQSMIDRNYALFEYGLHMTRLVVLRNGEVIYARDCAFGLAQLISDVIMRFGVSEESAKNIVHGNASGPDGYDSLLLEHIEVAAQEAQRTMQLFATSTAFVSADEIYLHGDACQMNGLDSKIEKTLGVKCSIIDPLQGLAISQQAIDVQKYAPSLLVACGLAYRRFDK